MPPRRPPGRHRRGRHRKPKNSGAPAYFTAATLAAFAVGGLNVPGAIGASHDATHASTGGPSSLGAAASASELRGQIVVQQAARASRTRTQRAAAASLAREARRARVEAKRRAREAAERARPKWVAPILGYRLSAGFGETSFLWSSAHTGQDFAAPWGSPVRAAGDGTVIFAGWDGAYGNKIAVQHAGGIVTWYAHLSSFVRTEGSVRAGDIIGRVGNTGNSTGAHLHFEVHPGGDDGTAIDPMPWLRAHKVRV